MPLVWLVRVPYRTERSDHSGTRKRRRLTHSDWLPEKCRVTHVHVDWHGRVESSNGEAHYTMVGLMNVALGTQWHGPTTMWSEEALAMKEYYDDPADAYTVAVTNSFKLLEPRPVHVV